MSKRLQILNALQEKLASILVANGYKTDIGNKVEYWKDLDFEYGEGAIAFRDNLEDMADKNQPYQMCLYVEIRAIKFTNNALEESCLILEDLINLCKDQNWNGLSLKTFLLSNEKEIETAGQKAIKVMLKIKIIYRED